MWRLDMEAFCIHNISNTSIFLEAGNIVNKNLYKLYHETTQYSNTVTNLYRLAPHWVSAWDQNFKVISISAVTCNFCWENIHVTQYEHIHLVLIMTQLSTFRHPRYGHRRWKFYLWFQQFTKHATIISLSVKFQCWLDHTSK